MTADLFGEGNIIGKPAAADIQIPTQARRGCATARVERANKTTSSVVSKFAACKIYPERCRNKVWGLDIIKANSYYSETWMGILLRNSSFIFLLYPIRGNSSF
jgi:hypothetical protein